MTSIGQSQQAINVLLDFLYAVDTNDRALLESVLHPEVIYDNTNVGKVLGGDFPVMQGAKTVTEYIMTAFGPMDTAHYAHNVRSSPLEDGRGQQIRFYSTGHHYLPGEGIAPDKQGIVSGADVTVDIVNDTDRRMKIKEFKGKVLWVNGDLSAIVDIVKDAAVGK